ncbi:MAG: TetR/AcrR family transcriptional regulator, partial [Firmicutes bacterium]|nr:TetR/AcrR family transcriptional regulator [Bacillota bacterium]
MPTGASPSAKESLADTLPAGAAPIEQSMAAPAKRAEQERSRVSRRRLIDAGVSALMDMGYSAMTLSEIARRAGLTTGAVQYHFGSKDDLLLEMLDVLFLGTSFLAPESETEASVEGMELYRRCEIFV